MGTGDLYNAVNGLTDSGIPVRLTVTRTDANILRLDLAYDWDSITYNAYLTDMVDSPDHMHAQGQTGILREIITMDRSGIQVVGSYHQEDQISSGNYNLIRTITFDVSR